MLKAKIQYLLLVPAGNDQVLANRKVQEGRFTRLVLSGKDMDAYLENLPAISIERMELFELKQRLLVKAVSTVAVMPFEEVQSHE